MEKDSLQNSNAQKKHMEIRLNPENLFVIKDSDKDNFKLKIQLKVSGKEEIFFLDLNQNKNLKSELEESKKQNSELKEIIKIKEEKIKFLEEQVNKLNTIIEKEKEKERIVMNNNTNFCSSYNDFDIKLKEPLHILNTHSSDVKCLTILKIQKKKYIL